MPQSVEPIAAAQAVITEIRETIAARLLGLDHAVDSLCIALMTHGHILLEDVPGVGKTELAKTFADALGLSFRRIQCTPDLMPADIVGGLVFHPREAEFVLRRGPIFTHVLLVDEINRALPRTQSALLEAMAEGQVTIDGTAHRLPQPFLVMATQNPLESQGVFPLPEAQLDRFLLKTSLGYPAPRHDLGILSLHLQNRPREDTRPLENSGDPGSTPAPISILEEAVTAVRFASDVLAYVAAITRATRTRPDIEVGASPRAMILLAQAARAQAVLAGRNFVIPDDVQKVAARVLFHRLLRVTADEDVDPEAWMADLLGEVRVPLEDEEIP